MLQMLVASGSGEVWQAPDPAAATPRPVSDLGHNDGGRNRPLICWPPGRGDNVLEEAGGLCSSGVVEDASRIVEEHDHRNHLAERVVSTSEKVPLLDLVDSHPSQRGLPWIIATLLDGLGQSGCGLRQFSARLCVERAFRNSDQDVGHRLTPAVDWELQICAERRKMIVANTTCFEENSPMIRVWVLKLPDGMASSLAITLDALETANQISVRGGRRAPFEVRTLRVGQRVPAVPADFARRDLLIVPGLGIRSEGELLACLATKAVRRAARIVAEARALGASIAGSCAGTFILAQAGVLTEGRATTTWWLAPAFRRLHPDVELIADRIVVADWPIATAGAAMAQMDLMLAVIAKFASPGLSDACARYLLLDHRKSQAPYMAVGFLAGRDEQIARAEVWARNNIERDFSMDELAAAAGLSPRTFARRLASVCGLSPIKFAQRIRIEAAERLLETTRLSVDEVARQVGYAEPSTLRRLIRREARPSPAELRRGS